MGAGLFEGSGSGWGVLEWELGLEGTFESETTGSSPLPGLQGRRAFPGSSLMEQGFSWF